MGSFKPSLLSILFQFLPTLMNQFNKLDAASHDQDKVTLNVGGELFTTYRSTILESGSSVLCDLVNSTHGQKTQQEPIFIDRNGELFRDIIYCIRTNLIYTRDLAKLVALHEEAIYYKLDTMSHALKVWIDSVKAQQERRQKKPRVILKDVKEMWKTLHDTKAEHRTTYKITEEKNGVETAYSVLDIVYIKDINTCFEHGKAYCACSSTPKLVLIPKSTDK